MKKYLLLLFCPLLICSCSNNAVIKPETKNLQFTVTAKHKKQNYLFKANSDENSNLTLTIKKPENLKNMTLRFNDKNCEFEFLGLKKEFPFDSIERETPIIIFYEAFINATKAQTLEFKNNQYYLEYRLNDEKFEFNFSQSGLPLSINGINNDTKIIISSVKILN